MAVKRVVDISEADERHVALQEGTGQLSKEGMIFDFTCIEMFDEEEALRAMTRGWGEISGRKFGSWQPWAAPWAVAALKDQAPG